MCSSIRERKGQKDASNDVGLISIAMYVIKLQLQMHCCA